MNFFDVSLIILGIVFIIFLLVGLDKSTNSMENKIFALMLESKYLNNFNKESNKIEMHIDGNIISGIAIRNVENNFFTIEIKESFILEIARYDILEFCENIRYKNDFQISFILSSGTTMKIVSIDNKEIIQSNSVNYNIVKFG